jgi:uncharacterized protein YidB (DUF937 family)
MSAWFFAANNWRGYYMALFDAIINDVGARFGLGANAAPLVREVVHFVVTPTGGLAGLFDKFKSAGLGSEFGSWLGNTDGAALTVQQVESVVSSSVLAAIGNRLGLGGPLVSSAVGYVLPKVIGALTGCGGDQIDDHAITDQGFGAPILRDEREQPVLYLVPFAGSRREVMNLDRQAEFVGEFLQLAFPWAHARTITAAAIRGNDQPPRQRITNAAHVLLLQTNHAERLFPDEPLD